MKEATGELNMTEIKRKICMSGSGSSLFALYYKNDKDYQI